MTLAAQVNQLEARHLAQRKGAGVSRKQHQVMRVLSLCALTRRRMHNMTGIDISSLCSILKALIAKGYVAEGDSVVCPTTRLWVLQYKLTRKGSEYVN